jgi:hypothetical protein
MSGANPLESGDGWTYDNGFRNILNGADVTVTGTSDGARCIAVPRDATATILTTICGI